MPVEDIRCPSCRAPQRDLKPGVPHRCVFCKHEFTYVAPNAAKPHAPVTVFAPDLSTPRKPSSAGGLVVAAATVMVIVGAMTALVLFKSSAPAPMPPASVSPVYSSQSSPTPVMPIAPVAVAPAAEPSAEVTSVSEGRTSIGGRFFLADYANTGTVPINAPAIVASGFDANGARVVEQPGFAERGNLAPGEHVIILALVAEPPPNVARFEVTARPPQTGGYAAHEVAVEVVESSEHSTGGSMHELVGTVRNTSATALRFVRVVAVGRDADGKAVAFANGMPTRNELAAGEESGFRLSVGTFEISRPARWDLVCFGQPH